MAIEGPLRELGIHDVFQLLDLSRKTGVLRVASELRNNAGTIYFEDGAIVYAEIRSNPHPLGSLLLRTGRVNEADLDRARDMQVRGGDRRRIGEILVELGVVTPRELQRQVRFQIEEVVFEVMGWREGYFSFTEGPLTEVPAESAVRIPTEALLMEGARRIDEWARIEKRLPHLGVVPAFAAPAGSEGDLDLLPPEWEVLALIDGQRDVRAIAAGLGRSDFDVAKTMFGLESAGLVVLTDPGTRPRASDAGGGTGAVGPPHKQPCSSPRPRMRSANATSPQRVARRSKPPCCCRTIRPCTSCSAASTWPAAGRRMRSKSCDACCGSIRCYPPPTGTSAMRWSQVAGSLRR